VLGLLGGSQELLYVLSDLLRLTDDVLCAWQGGIFLPLLPQLHCFRGWKRAAVNEKEKILYYSLPLFALHLRETGEYRMQLRT